MDPKYKGLHDSLLARGFDVAWGFARVGAGSGYFVAVELEAPSQIVIVDYEDDPAESGWCAEHTDISGTAYTIVHVDATRREVEAMADAVTEFVRRRNRESLAYELTWSIDSHLFPGVGYHIPQSAADTYTDSAGTWVTVRPGGPGDEAHLMVASYPEPDRGVHTDGQLITGWTVSVQRPDAGPAVLYDAPGDADTRPLMAAIKEWVGRFPAVG